MLDKNSLAQLKQLKTQIHEATPRFTGIVKGSTGRHGFIQVAGEKRNVYLPQDAMQRVFPGDEVQFTVEKDEKGRDMAKLEKLIQSELADFSGEVVSKGNNLFVVPDIPDMNRWLFLPPNLQKKAKAGDMVLARINRHPYKSSKPQAKIECVIGHKTDKGIELDYAIAKHALSHEWPKALVESLDSTLEQRFAAARENRSDLQDQPFFTIDGESAKDLDDALCIAAQDDGWLLKVAIADPTALIEPGSELEQELLKRGNSFYLPGKTRHMLPETMATNWCSLLPEQPRLAMVVELVISSTGETRLNGISQALISSKAQLSYQQAQQYLDKPEDNPIAQQLQVLEQARQAMLQYRNSNHLVMEEKPDYRFVMNDDLKPVAIAAEPRLNSHRIVEECMLACNKAIALHLRDNFESALYSGHAGFKAERIERVQELISKTHPDYAVGDLGSLDDYRQLIRHVQHQPSEEPVYKLLSKQLDRGLLSLTAQPHMGLGLECYTTFTSPMRKLQDYWVHRIIKSPGTEAVTITDQQLTDMQLNLQHIRQASRLCEQWLKCQLMQQAQKQDAKTIYQGKVQHQNSRQITVVLDETGIDGMIDCKSLGAKISFDPLRMKLTCQELTLRLGDPVQVVVDRIDFSRRQIQFKLAK